MQTRAHGLRTIVLALMERPRHRGRARWPGDFHLVRLVSGLHDGMPGSGWCREMRKSPGLRLARPLGETGGAAFATIWGRLRCSCLCPAASKYFENSTRRDCAEHAGQERVSALQDAVRRCIACSTIAVISRGRPREKGSGNGANNAMISAFPVAFRALLGLTGLMRAALV